MASVAVMVIGGAVLNAVTFIGGNKLMSYFDSDAANDERIRHDLAQEKYEKDLDEYNTKLRERNTFLAEMSLKENNAEKRFSDVNMSLEEYYNLDHIEKPTLDYEPSEDQKKYELVYNGASLALVAVGIISYFV